MFNLQHTVPQHGPDSVTLTLKQLRPLRIVVHDLNWAGQCLQLSDCVSADLLLGEWWAVSEWLCFFRHAYLTSFYECHLRSVTSIGASGHCPESRPFRSQSATATSRQTRSSTDCSLPFRISEPRAGLLTAPVATESMRLPAISRTPPGTNHAARPATDRTPASSCSK